MKNNLLFLLFLTICSTAFAQKKYYKMQSGKILSEAQYAIAKQNASKKEKVEEVILKTEQKADSIIYTIRFSIIYKDEQGHFFDSYAEPKKLLGKHFPIHNFLKADQKKYLANMQSGKPTLISMWSTTSIPCIMQLPVLNKLKEKYDSQVNFIAIAYDKKDVVNNFLKQQNFSFLHITDAKDALNQLNILIHPTNLILDKNGDVRFVYGVLNDKFDDLCIILDELKKK